MMVVGRRRDRQGTAILLRLVLQGSLQNAAVQVGRWGGCVLAAQPGLGAPALAGQHCLMHPPL